MTTLTTLAEVLAARAARIAKRDAAVLGALTALAPGAPPEVWCEADSRVRELIESERYAVENADALARENALLRLALLRADGAALTRAEAEIARRRGEEQARAAR